MSGETAPRTAREALTLELMGDIGRLDDKIKKLPSDLHDALLPGWALMEATQEKLALQLQSMPGAADKELKRASQSALLALSGEVGLIAAQIASHAVAGEMSKTKALILAEQKRLVNKYALLGVAIFLASGLSGFSIQYGLSVTRVESAQAALRASQALVVEAEARAAAAETVAKNALDQSSSAAKSAADATSKNLSGQIASLTAKLGFFATRQGAAILSCDVPGWRRQTLPGGQQICIFQESGLPVIVDSIPLGSF